MRASELYGDMPTKPTTKWDQNQMVAVQEYTNKVKEQFLNLVDDLKQVLSKLDYNELPIKGDNFDAEMNKLCGNTVKKMSETVASRLIAELNEFAHQQNMKNETKMMITNYIQDLKSKVTGTFDISRSEYVMYTSLLFKIFAQLTSLQGNMDTLIQGTTNDEMLDAQLLARTAESFKSVLEQYVRSNAQLKRVMAQMEQNEVNSMINLFKQIGSNLYTMAKDIMGRNPNNDFAIQLQKYVATLIDQTNQLANVVPEFRAAKKFQSLPKLNFRKGEDGRLANH